MKGRPDPREEGPCALLKGSMLGFLPAFPQVNTHWEKGIIRPFEDYWTLALD